MDQDQVQVEEEVKAVLKSTTPKATPNEIKLQKELAIANNKAANYFHELEALKKTIEEKQQRATVARKMLFQGIEVALNNFNMIE